MGMTFDSTIALLNHSCNPNAAIVFDQNFASIRSIKDIARNEQVTIAYVDTTLKRARRRQELREQYFFECHCPGCEPPDNEFTGRDSWVCENQKCQALIAEPLLRGKLTCLKCHTKQTASLDALRSLEAKAFSVLESPPSQNLRTLMNDYLLPTLASLNSCPSWPPIRQPAPALRRQIFQLSLDDQLFDAAYHHANALSSIPLINIYPEPYHPLKTVMIFTSASLMALLAAQENNVDYLKRAWELLKAAWELCKGTHGEKSQFGKRIAVKRAEVEADLAMGGENIRQWMRMNS